MMDDDPRESFRAHIMRLITRHVSAILFACLIAGPLLWLALDRENPVVRLAGKILPANPPRGSFVAVKWDTVTISRWCPGTVFREIIDSENVVWRLDPVASTYSLSIGDRDVVRAFQLPSRMALGFAKYRSTVSFVCNPLHNIWPIISYGPDVVFNVTDPAPD